MEIQIPENMKKQVEVIKQLQESHIAQFKSMLDKVVPVGYTLKVEDRKHLSVFKTPTNKEDLRYTYSFDNLISNLSDRLIISNKATSQDIYNLCGLLQLLVEVDILLLGDFIISK